MERLGEHGYRRALEVISSYHHRQAEKEAATRRQQQAEAARWQHLASLVKELEQQRQQGELPTADRAESLRTEWARGDLATAERQNTEWIFASAQRCPIGTCVVFYSCRSVSSHLPTERNPSTHVAQ